MDENELLEPFERLLADAAPPAMVRGIDEGASAEVCWSTIADSGFLDALVPEDSGGAGLGLAEIAPLLCALGSRAVPVPVGETMIARALLGQAGIRPPEGAIVLVTATPDGSGWRTPAIPLAGLASHALVELDGSAVLIALSPELVEAVGVHGSRAATLRLPRKPEILAEAAVPSGGLRAAAAIVRATAIAGAANRLLDMTVAYANERVQFGKPIGRQQALQQQLAVMAEHVIAARMAAEIVCAAGFPASLFRVAVAKTVTSQAAVPIATIAHAVHGAIGISEEYDLQLFTRRLHEWRLADGSEAYWSRLLGGARIESDTDTSIAFIREAARSSR